VRYPTDPEAAVTSTTLAPLPLPLLLWDGSGAWSEEPAPEAGLPVLVDSWLVRHGRVRDLDGHWARFEGAARECGVPAGRLATFRSAVVDALPRTGLWFPRVEVHAAPDDIGGAAAAAATSASASAAAAAPPRLALRLRRAPALRMTAKLWVAEAPDPRTRPDRKGPDFAIQEHLRRLAGEHGADEAVLLSPTGRVREGAFSSLVWWDGPDLCTAPDDGTVLPSITRRLLIDRCSRIGVAVRFESRFPDHVARRETWILSALHGIRLVTSWDERPAPEPDTRRLTAHRAYLASILRSLPAAAAGTGPLARALPSHQSKGKQ
jgi:branched-subunit amino acid aminotransferase/4-amino-4-deoxychorismate lyase